MASIQLGQIWRSSDTGEEWLVTKVYAELFTSYVVLRKAGGGDSNVRRVKVEKSSQGVALPGFTLVQETESS